MEWKSIMNIWNFENGLNQLIKVIDVSTCRIQYTLLLSCDSWITCLANRQFGIEPHNQGEHLNVDVNWPYQTTIFSTFRFLLRCLCCKQQYPCIKIESGHAAKSMCKLDHSKVTNARSNTTLSITNSLAGSNLIF